MSDVMQYGLIGLLTLAVAGLGIKATLSYKGGNKVNMKNIKAKGDVVGRDKK